MITKYGCHIKLTFSSISCKISRTHWYTPFNYKKADCELSFLTCSSFIRLPSFPNHKKPPILASLLLFLRLSRKWRVRTEET